MLCASCKQNPATSLYVIQKPQIRKMLCEGHPQISKLQMNPEYLESNIKKLEIFFNQFTSKTLQIINNYKSKVFYSYLAYEQASYEFNDDTKSNQQKISAISQIQFNLGTYEMKRLFQNPYFAALNISSEISKIINEYKPKEILKNYSSISTNDTITIKRSSENPEFKNDFDKQNGPFTLKQVQSVKI